MAESFAHLLKRDRVAAGLSQETLAERAGVSVDAISYLERDARHAPQKATLDLLIAALALDDDARDQLEEAAKAARARGPQTLRHGVFPDSPDEFLPNNLPPQLTSFVDRKREVAELKEKLQSHRLVTVVGAGGAGKTRCAIEIAADMLGGFGDGVWLAELAQISDPMLITTAIARALRVQQTPNRPMLDMLLAYLKRKRLLLILDNCEHVIDEARHVVAAILHGCPDVRTLATSRESLSIAGEHVYRMPSLPVPSTSALLSANEMSQYGAVQLFANVTLDGVPNSGPALGGLAFDPNSGTLFAADRESGMAEIARIVAHSHLPGASARLEITAEFKPLVASEESKRLYALYAGCARDLGQAVREEFAGGCADSGFAASVGAPTICGVGPIGGRAHSPDEFLEVDTIIPRAQALALAVMRLG